jgi:hypothetical protein
MATKRFTRAQLEGTTAVKLKEMCVYDLALPGLTKKPKETVINAILAKYGTPAAKASLSKAPAAPAGEVTSMEFSAQSTLTKPSAPFGSRTTTTIHVSSGASSGNFPVIGRTVKQVGEFLREVLNVDQLSTGLVNGREVGPDYVLKEGDNLEFLKPAGKKG